MLKNYLGQLKQSRLRTMVSGDVSLFFPVLLFGLVVGAGFALRWWKKKKEEDYEIVEEVIPLEQSKSLQTVEQAIAQKKKS